MVPRIDTLLRIAAFLLGVGCAFDLSAANPPTTVATSPPTSVVASTASTPIPVELPFGDLTTRYRVVQWKVEQGLPQNHVTCLLQTHDGYIWVGTVFGLARYDGVRFTVFEKSTLPWMEETDDHILGLGEDNEQALWVCTRNGLLRHQDHVWTGFKTGGEQLRQYQPTGVCTASGGGVWIGVQGAILRFFKEGPKEEIKLQFTPPVRSVRMLTEDSNGILYVADRYRVMRVDPVSHTAEVIFDYTQKNGWVHYLIRDPHGKVRFGGDFGAYEIVDGRPQPLKVTSDASQQLLRSRVNSYGEDPQGRFWFVADGRLCQFQPGDSNGVGELIGSHNHPGLASVEKVLVDAAGNLWVGTSYDGLLFLQERRLTTLQVSKERAENDVWSVCQDARGSIWFGTSRDLFRWKDEAVTHFSVPHPSIHKGQIFSLYPDPQGFLWVGYAGLGLFKLKEEQWEYGPVVNLNGASSGDYHVRCLLTAADGSLWFGMPDGLHHFARGQHTLYTPKDGLAGKDVRALLEDRSGRLWAGTYDSGVSRFCDGKFENFSKASGLAHPQIASMCEDSNGAVWIGTASGLTRYKDGSFSTLTRRQGLFDNLVNHILADDYGSFWISCNRGIYRISIQEANAVADGLLKTLTSVPFGEADGMQSAETNGGTQPAGWKGKDGILWFPSTKGLVRIDPKRIESVVNPSRVVVEQVIADGRIAYGDGMGLSLGSSAHSVSDAMPLIFEPDDADVLEIRYTTSCFEEPTKVRFQYRMVGHDREWQEAGDRRVTHYTNLNPGSYEFQIRACDHRGVWGPIDRQLRFKIRPHIYQTWWFYVSMVALVVLIGYGIQFYRLRIQHRIWELEKQHALEKERARIAKDMHDDLGARLTQLGMISELVESPGFQPDPEGTRRIPKVSQLAREAVRSLDEIVWAVSPGKNSLDQLAGYLVQTAQDFIAPSGVRFELVMPSSIPPLPLTTEMRHNVFLVSKEALNNAMKHAGARCIRLEFVFTTEEASFVISDDGRGFVVQDASHSGNGLANMRKRAESVGASFDLRSQPNAGTWVQIRFPLRREAA